MPALVRPYAHVWYVPSAAMRGAARGTRRRLRRGARISARTSISSGACTTPAGRFATTRGSRWRTRIACGRWRGTAGGSPTTSRSRHCCAAIPSACRCCSCPGSPRSPGAPRWAGSPAPVVVLTAVRAARLRRALAGRLPGAGAWAVHAAVDTSVREARDLGRALAGPWAPFALAALALSRGRRRRGLALRLVTPIAVVVVRDWLTDRPDLDPLSYAALRLADESSRGAGIWLGCLRARDFRALLARRPPPPSRR